MSVCDRTCADCVFRSKLNFHGIICNYLAVMGRRRGCPAGKGCLRKVKGPKRESLDARLYKIPPNLERKAMPPPPAQIVPEKTEAEKAAELEKIAERKRKKAEYHREWAKKNREKVRAYQRERWRKKREAEGAGTTNREGKDRG